jgi:hypothetical protein
VKPRDPVGPVQNGPAPAYPRKRPPRPRRDQRPKPGQLDVLRVLVSLPTLHREAATLPSWKPGDDGRPNEHPPVVHLIFGIMAWVWGSFRATEREFSQPEVWGIVSTALAQQFPEFRCFQPDGTPIDRFDHRRYREKVTLDDETFDLLCEAVLQDAVDLALELGMLDKSVGGTETHMHPSRVVSGDGTVLAPRYKAAPGDVQVDRETGEIVQKLHDPDVGHYTTGDKRRVSGTKWVITQAANGHEDERVIFTLTNQPKGHPGGEAAIGVRDAKRIKALAPGMQGLNWDKAMRGTNMDELYDAGLQTIVKVALVNGQAKSRRVGWHEARRGTTPVGKVEVFAIGGVPHIPVPVAGKVVPVRLEKEQVFHRRNRGGSTREYTRYQIPDAAPVPQRLRNAKVTMRMNGRCVGDDPSLNRSEVLRTVVEADTVEWARLNYGRPGTESTNSWLKDRLSKRRAPSVGIRRQKFDLLCAQLYNNVRALIAYRRRLGLPDVGDDPALGRAA